MVFHTTTRIRRTIAAALAVGVVGAGAAGVAASSATANSSSGKVPVTATTTTNARGAPAAAATLTSTVPRSVTRAETAAEDVIGFLEKGQPAKSRAEARLLQQLAHGRAATDLTKGGVTAAQVTEFQRRADRVAQLSASAAPRLQVSLAANHVSQLMPAFYGRFHDPVPPSVLKLDYLERQVQLSSIAGSKAGVRSNVAVIAATWTTLRPAVVAAGGASVARSYDAHVQTLQKKASPDSVQKQALLGLGIVDNIEKAFLA